MLFWSNPEFERPLTVLPTASRDGLINAAAVAALYCFLVEVDIMVHDYQRFPGGVAVQPPNLPRYTRCLIRAAGDVGLGQLGHRGIVVSTEGPEQVWPVAPVGMWSGNGHIYHVNLGRHSITQNAIAAVRRLGPQAQLPALENLGAIPVPHLVVTIHLKRIHR